jgi:hypothetical protein
MNVFGRIGLWFGCLLFSVTLFSLGWGAAAYGVFRLTMIFALPVACLYLPFVIALKDAEGRRIWTILLSGILIGPAVPGLLGLFVQLRGQLRGEDVQKVWQGEFGLGLGSGMIYASIVGFLTTVCYVIALKTQAAARYHR